METKLDRRQFLKYSGAGLTALGISTLNIPFFRMGRANAALSPRAWQFGVMSDTQWKNYPGGENTCATGIIDALNQQFIQHGCKFVIQVGDLCNDERVDGTQTMPTRATHAQALYDAGIDFFPIRGNHESSGDAAQLFPTLFPQTQGEGENFFGARRCRIQASSIDTLKGLSYTFDYNNIRCIMIDQFVRQDGSNYNGNDNYNDNMLDQIDWVENMLTSAPRDQHIFVFSHKNLMGQNHKDNLFGESVTSNQEERDKFLTSLYNNGIGYYMGGHDHMHHRSLVSTTDGLIKVPQIITSSNSYKFYTPREGDDGRETPMEQELYTIGYYIVTVDGPRITVDFYSSSHGSDYGAVSLMDFTPEAFFLRERFGYSLNGERFEIAQGESYTNVISSCDGTTAKILSGTNSDDKTDILGRKLVKSVNTGWAESHQVENTASLIFTVWGLTDNLSLYDEALEGELPDADESQQTDTYALSISYDQKKITNAHIMHGKKQPPIASQLMSGNFAIATRNENGEWVNAVDLNFGDDSKSKFVKGPWKASYKLGTYGVDPGTKTVWAVLNHEGDFVAKLI